MSLIASRICAAALEKSAPDLAVGAVREAAETIAPEWSGRGELPPYLIRRCLDLAARATEKRRKDASAPKPAPQFSGYARISGTQALEQIEPTVRHVRYSYFNTMHRVGSPWGLGERAPFESYEEAFQWLERERQETRLSSLSVEEQEHKNSLTDEIKLLTWELEDLTGWTVHREPEPFVTVHYEDPKGQERELFVGRLDSLATFATWVYRLSLWTGFREPDMVRYILCGTRPSLAAIAIRLEPLGGDLLDGTKISRDQVLIELRTPDLGRERTERLIALIGEQWRRSRTAVPVGQLKSEDGILYEIIADLGGVDREKQPYRFWTEVARRWEEAGQRPVTTKALMKRWRKVRPRVPELGPARHRSKKKGGR